MNKVDPAIIKETGFIALVTFILSVILESVFLIIGMWDFSVLLGNLLGAVIGILNFFLMGLGLQKALNKEAKEAKATVSFSHTIRFFLMAAVIVLAIILDIFNVLSAVLSLFFPTIGVYIRAIAIKKNLEEVSQ